MKNTKNVIDTKIETTREEGLELDVYCIEFAPGIKRYFAEFPLFKGCVGSGNTRGEAIEEAKENQHIHKCIGSMISQKVNIADII